MEDPRVAELIGQKQDGGGMHFIGFPSEEGVRRNGGRTGAAQAPHLIYEQLLKLTPHAAHYYSHSECFARSQKLTEIPLIEPMEEHQEALGQKISQTWAQGGFPIIIGGGHETSFGHFLGYANYPRNVSILNIDAHADVRPFKNGLSHSGSPFQQALRHSSERAQSYHVLGINPTSAAKKHLEFVALKGSFCFEEELSPKMVSDTLDQIKASHIMATMDMDAVRQAEAPGVSAPNAGGISARLWLKIALILGQHPKVSSFDIAEVNPKYDRDNATIKLAALTLWYFSLGLALRPSRFDA